MRRALRVTVAGTLLALVAACGGAGAPTVRGSDPWGKEISGPGKGSFVFDDYKPLADRPVKVYYQAPDSVDQLRTAKILVVVPGTGRDAIVYRSEWARAAKRAHALLLVPELSEDEFPGVTSYNLGNVLDEHGALNPPEKWSFQLVEQIFLHVRADVRSMQTSYAVFGHSAGAQFVHRMVMLLPSRHVRVAVAANAGWYTMPDDRVRFPYGLSGSPVSESQLGPAFAEHLTVLLGGADVDTNAKNLRRDAGADAQGLNRLQRGTAFFAEARAAALEHHVTFDWSMQVVPGVAHDGAAMGEAAASIVLRAG